MELTPKQKDRQRIVSAACRKGTTIIASPRHFDSICRRIIEQIEQDNPEWWYDAEQGFVDQFGNFLTRKEAWVVAVRQNQIIRDHNLCVGTLYSEHLY